MLVVDRVPCVLNYDDLLSESNQLRIDELSADDYKFLHNFAII